MAIIKKSGSKNTSKHNIIDHEANIRANLITLLKENYGEKAIFLPEISLLRGKNIIDLLAVNNTNFHGFEIKSGADTLKRLPQQSKTYEKVFDYITLVIHAKHLKKSEEIVPGWWGIILVDDNYELEPIRIATSNPHKNLRYLCRLLWREDLLQIMRDNNIKGKSGSKAVLINKILKKVNENEIKDLIRSRLHIIDTNKCPECGCRFVKGKEQKARTLKLIEGLEQDKKKFLSTKHNLPEEVERVNIANINAMIYSLKQEYSSFRCTKCGHEYIVERDNV